MSTNKRKERRTKQLIEDGRNARAIEAQAMAEKKASDEALAIALKKVAEQDQEIQNLLAKIAEGTEAIEHGLKIINGLRACNAHVDDLVGDDCLLCQIESLQNIRAEQSSTIADLKTAQVAAEKRIADLEAEDKDAAKLRRRLREAKDRISQLNRQIAQEKRAELF